MNHRVKTQFDTFVLADNEQMVIERALYSLLDRYKEDRINNYCANFPVDYNRNIEACFRKLRHHENYRNNKKFFVVEVPNHDPDPVEDILGIREEAPAVA